MERSDPPELLLFFVDGVCGAGKSWLIKNFNVDDNKTDNLRIIKVFEDEASFNSYGEYAPLSLTQRDPRMNGVVCQFHIIECLNERLRKIVLDLRNRPPQATTKYIILLMDRSLYSPLVFSRLLQDQGHMSMFSCTFLQDTTIRKADETLKDLNLKVIGLFLLDTPINVCLKNIKIRSRYYEILNAQSRGYTLNYLYNMRLRYTDHLLWWKRAKGLENIFHSRSANLVSLGKAIENSFHHHQKLCEGELRD